LQSQSGVGLLIANDLVTGSPQFPSGSQEVSLSRNTSSVPATISVSEFSCTSEQEKKAVMKKPLAISVINK